MAAAVLWSQLGTCHRRKVGCVLVDRYGYVSATGYNGVGRGQIHCIDLPCAGHALPSGKGLDKCQAIHAEQNALLQCSDITKLNTCYSTVAPCTHCVKMLLNTACSRIVILEEYPHHSEKVWTDDGRKWDRITPQDVSTALANSTNHVVNFQNRGSSRSEETLYKDLNRLGH